MTQIDTSAVTGELGTLTEVDLRGTWPHEAITFTPWLGEEENLARLANELGLELELEGVEVPVGPYSADILAKDVGTGDYVVIENQLEKTNPDNQDKIIALHLPGDLSNKEEWPGYIDWITNNVVAFRKAFQHRIKKLDLSTTSDEEREA